MPISRPEKFTVTQTHGLAQNRICFPTENEPIFRYRRPGLKPESDAKTNSQYAIQKTGVNSSWVHADHQGAPAAILFLRSPDPLQKIKNEAISHLSVTTPECEAQTLKNTAQSQFEMLSPGQPAYERSREGPARGRFSATRPSRLTYRCHSKK